MCVLAVIAGTAGTARAQGALSLLGFGYPVGGTSTRGVGSGGSLAGLDPQSPMNPAAIVLGTRLQGYFQFEPEFRSVQAGGPAVNTTTTRFPLFMVSGQQERATFALSFSSFMDRTWSNSYADTQSVGTERIPSTVFTSSVGGIADVRAAMAWTFSEQFHVGAAVHLFPGENRVTLGRIFADSSKAGGFQLDNRYSFTGTAMSFGAVWLTGHHIALGGDVRLGGAIRMRLGDTTLVGSGTIPLRAGLTASYDGLAGTVFTVRVGKERWTDFRGLGSSALGLKDATDVSVGMEVLGPSLGATPMVIRTGYRVRGLPFTYGTTAVREGSFAGGLGIPVGGSRAMLDLGVSRATRTAATITEKAWLMSIGVGIRP